MVSRDKSGHRKQICITIDPAIPAAPCISACRAARHPFPGVRARAVACDVAGRGPAGITPRPGGAGERILCQTTASAR